MDTRFAPVRVEATYVNGIFVSESWEPGYIVHWYGMAIGEFAAGTNVPAWANGCLDQRSIADTPRFNSLREAQAAIDQHWERRKKAQADREAAMPAAQPDPVLIVNLMGNRDDSDDQPDTCWECGLPITDGHGIMDAMGMAHRSCVGA